MAVFNATDCDLHFKRVPWQTVSATNDYGLNLGAAVWGNDVTRTSNDIFVGTSARDVRIPIRLSAGELQILVSYHNGTPDFGTPDEDRTVDSTVDEIILSSKDDTTSYVTVRGISGAAGATVVLAELEVGGQLLVPPEGNEGMHEAQFALTNKLDATYSLALT